MSWYFLLATFLPANVQNTPILVNDADEVSQANPSEELGECEKGVKSLKNAILGLEFFLKDKKDYKTSCSGIKWNQPALDVYKNEPKSYLPEECKINEDKE
jgi:hypothetical protein